MKMKRFTAVLLASVMSISTATFNIGASGIAEAADMSSVKSSAAAVTKDTTAEWAGDRTSVRNQVLERIEVTAPTKLVYHVGDELDTEGMEVKAFYDDSSEADVTDDVELSGYDAQQPGEQTVTVTYEDKTDTFTVNVLEVEELKEVIEAAEALNLEEYKDGEEKAAFTEALASAKEAMKNAETQEEIDEAKDALVEAGKKLEKKDSTEEPENPDGSENPGGSENPDGSENPGGSENPDDSEKPGDSENPDGSENPEEPSFGDVNEDDWFFDYINDVYEKGYMTGMGGDSNSFAPADNIVRAQFAVILYRMAGTPKVEYKDTFEDVKEGNFYSEAVIWANENGIIQGYEDSKLFGPADIITREQMATMMFRYAQLMKMDVTDKTDLGIFPDGDKVTDFAEEAMKWIVAKGVISGKGEDVKILDPQGEANRAEAATIISRFSEI